MTADQTAQAIALLSEKLSAVIERNDLLVQKVESLERSVRNTRPKFKVYANDGGYVNSDDEEVEVTLTGVETSPIRKQAKLDISAKGNGMTVSASQTSAATDEELKALYPERIVLTTYPGQVGVKPYHLDWNAAQTPKSRGPVICSRAASSFKRRNAIGAYSGSYSIYRALAVAMGELKPHWKQDLTNTEPVFHIGPYDSWSTGKIVSLDPYGADVARDFADELNEGLDVRPTIAITRAHMQLVEIQNAIANGSIKVDGKIVLGEDGQLNVTKGAVEPVWYLPGLAQRFNVAETVLRRTLFEDTGGMYPELITRADLKVFLPPIGGISIYIFGNPEYLSDPSKKLTARVHDECNGSDVFGSDICTCRPYLIFGIEECVRQAQQGGVGLVVYYRKEGRALGEVTKYLVYNARKRAAGGDTAADYFQRTENVAGVKDMRFQATMPDVLHYLGIKKIDRMISMSNMKHDAIVDSGIKILERVPIPDGMLPPDSKVEIDAKVAAGYFTTGKVPTTADLAETKGRTWDDIQH